MRSSSSQHVSSWSIAAMSAIEQPAARSGRITFWCGAREHVGALGHEVHAAEDDVTRPRGACAHCCASRNRVAGDVGELDDFVALIVMAEDQHTRSRARPARR